MIQLKQCELGIFSFVDDLDSQPLRQKRLGHDLRGLQSDASEGIRAKPLDSSYYHWQASVTG